MYAVLAALGILDHSTPTPLNTEQDFWPEPLEQDYRLSKWLWSKVVVCEKGWRTLNQKPLQTTPPPQLHPHSSPHSSPRDGPSVEDPHTQSNHFAQQMDPLSPRGPPGAQTLPYHHPQSDVEEGNCSGWLTNKEDKKKLLNTKMATSTARGSKFCHNSP